MPLHFPGSLCRGPCRKMHKHAIAGLLGPNNGGSGGRILVLPWDAWVSRGMRPHLPEIAAEKVRKALEFGLLQCCPTPKWPLTGVSAGFMVGVQWVRRCGVTLGAMDSLITLATSFPVSVRL